MPKFQCPSWPPAWPEISAAANAAIESGDWGRYRSDLQEQVCQSIGELAAAPHVRLCGSGTAAVELSLRAAGVGPGNEVVLAAFDYPGNLRSIEVTGARAVLVDIDPETMGMDPCGLENAASENVRAVIASHLYGNAARITEIKEICDAHQWVLIEDACQVPGMTIDDVPAGRTGHLATFSFGGSKPLTAGNGGAILTSESRFIAKINSLLDRPSDTQPLSSLQSAVLVPQLKRLTELHQMRRATVEFLQRDVIADLRSWRFLSKPQRNIESSHYKIAWSAQTTEHRDRILQQSVDFGLPVGEGFRSHHKCSPRRVRKPAGLDNAAAMGDSLFVLDHSALLLQPERYSELADALCELERSTRVSVPFDR